MKKTGRALAVTVGLAFITHQISRYLQAEEAHRAGAVLPRELVPPVEPPPAFLGATVARLAGVLDADGDGRITAADLATHGRRLCAFVGAPSGACVAGGFLLGLRQG